MRFVKHEENKADDTTLLAPAVDKVATGDEKKDKASVASYIYNQLPTVNFRRNRSSSDSVNVSDSNKATSFLSFAGFSAYVKSQAFRTLMYRLLLTVLIIAAALAMTAVLINPAAMPVAIAGVVAGLGALALKVVLPVAAAAATAAVIGLAHSFFTGRQAKQNAIQNQKENTFAPLDTEVKVEVEVEVDPMKYSGL